MKGFILVPVYNEGKVFLSWFPRLYSVLSRLDGDWKIVIIDDGSEESLPLEDSGDVVVLRHPLNTGVGSALGTGLAYVRFSDPDFVFTIDGDAQHDPEDLVSLYDVLSSSSVDLVNGSRFLKKQKIPFLRRIANFVGNIVSFSLSGYWVTDSQSGMKGFSKNALKKLQFYSPGYEWCIDVFREASWYRWKVKELPISVRYSAYTLGKGQHFALGLDMVLRLLVRVLTRKH